MSAASPFRTDALAGRRVLITGGGTGLGKGVAQHLLAHGAEVHLWGRRAGVLDEAVAELGAGAHAQVVDLRDAAAIDAAVDELWAAHGPLTGLVNNAAANFVVRTEDLSANGFDAVTSTIMRGSFLTTLAVGKRWIADGLPGSVVSNLVTWVWTGSAFVTAGAMAKTAVHAMTMSLAVEWARHGIRLNAVAPGPFPTEYAWKQLSAAGEQEVGATSAADVPAARYGEIPELGNLMAFLLGPGCDYLTGATIPIDGGHHLAAPSTFAGMTKMTDEDWADVRARSAAATAATKAQQQG